MRITRAQTPDGRVFRAVGTGYHMTRAAIIAKAPSPVNQVAPAGQSVSPALARILRPQAAYRWLLPQLAAITPQYIEMVLRGALAGNHVQQWELFDLMLDSWPELGACAQELTYGVTRLKMIFEPFAEEDEDPSPEAMERCKVVSSALRRMAPDAVGDENDLDGTLKDIIDGWFRGVTALEIDWQTIESSVHGTIVAPKSTFWVHPVCFAFGGDGRLGLRATGQGQSATISEFPPNKFLLGIHKAKSGSALGGALLRPLAWWWCAANFSADWLLNLAQIFGLPFRWANYDPNAPQETVDRICGMLQNMGSAAWAAFPAGTTLELKDTAKTGDHSPQGELLDRADRYARLLILGQTMSGGQDSSKGGGKAFGEVEGDVKRQRIDAAGRYACRVINTQLIPSILALNYGDTNEAPKVRLLEDEEGDLNEAQRDKTLADAGLKIPVSFLRKKYGLPAPAEGEETIGGKDAQNPKPDPKDLDDDFNLDDWENESPGISAGEFHGNQWVPNPSPAPPEIKIEEADRILTEGVFEKDSEGRSVHFGVRLKNKLESQAKYAGRKELLEWARETVRTGKRVRSTDNPLGEERDYYGKFFAVDGKTKGMMVIVDVKDGEAFNMIKAPRNYLRNKGLSAKNAVERDEPGQQRPVAVRRTIAAAGGAPDRNQLSLMPALVKLADIQDDALFAKALADLVKTL